MEKEYKFKLLEVYRGIAAILVVLFHITGEAWYKFHHYVFLGGFFNFGTIGVDFFFVLSGFIIFYTHHKDKPTKKNLITFFKKRVIRIYPTYWTIATIVILTYLFFNSVIIDKVPLTFTHIIATYTLLPHIKRFIFPSWTLTEELYFYLLFGVLLFIPSVKNRLVIFTGIGITLFIGSLFVTKDVINKTPILLQQAFIVPYVLEFVGGCIGGYVFSYTRHTIRISYFIFISCISLGLLVLALPLQTSNWYIPLITFAFSLFIWASGSLEATYRLSVNSFLLLLGKASYVIYLMHIFIFKIIEKVSYNWLLANASWRFFSICCLGIIACTSIPLFFYRYYEKPVLYFLRKRLV